MLRKNRKRHKKKKTRQISKQELRGIMDYIKSKVKNLKPVSFLLIPQELLLLKTHKVL